MSRVILLAFTASLNPTLLAATTLMLLLERPSRLMLGYLFGALLTSITLGLAIVSSFSSSGAAETTQRSISPGVDIALGVIFLVLARALESDRVKHRAERREESRKDKGPPRWQRALRSGSPRTTFVIGALLTLPGASYLAGLHQIHKLDYSTSGTVFLVVAFNLIMLWLLEVPLICFAVAPEWTPRAIERAKAWFTGHARKYAVRGLAIVGVLLVAKGVLGLVIG
ncbi:MAG: GAP family protein [Solirubrobacteraceae bacterium]